MYFTLLLLHILGATIWTGGHLILACSILPKALKVGDVEAIRSFEQKFEKIGIPALLTQVVTGIGFIHFYLSGFSEVFDWSNPMAKVISLKLVLLGLTLLLALDARLRIIPKLSQDNLSQLAWHIIPVTLISVLFVVLGVTFRTGGL